MLGVAGPAVRRDFELAGGIIVFVFGAAGVDSGGQSAGLFHVQRRAVIPIVAGWHFAIAIIVDRKPIEDLAIKFCAEPAFADLGGGISLGVGEDGVGV